jgi:hypothetical protein
MSDLNPFRRSFTAALTAARVRQAHAVMAFIDKLEAEVNHERENDLVLQQDRPNCHAPDEHAPRGQGPKAATTGRDS